MKKHALILAFFYLLNAVGYGLEVHYCLGQIADINYAFFDATCVCDETHEEVKRSNCCNDELFFVQISEAHQANQVADVHMVVPEIEICFEGQHNHAVIEPEIVSECLRAPPKPIDRVTVYHSFIFYA